MPAGWKPRSQEAGAPNLSFVRNQVISCRPSDWRPGSDLTTVRSKLPVPERGGDVTHRTSDEAFMEALRGDRGETSVGPQHEENPPSRGAVQTVAMLPMTDAQIQLFTQQFSMHDAGAFLFEVNRQKAWTFARRPLDLIDLISSWTNSGRLGTRAEQHQTNVAAKLKDDPDRGDSDVLADDRARRGAEQLALALALTRTRAIQSSAQGLDAQRSDGDLEPSTILPDWTKAQRRTLLRRALFDPASYGRVRFHHRSVQEYLAACRFRALRKKGMSTKALFRLLFAEQYGVEVVFPSMRPVAAWLALWDDAVRRRFPPVSSGIIRVSVGHRRVPPMATARRTPP